MELSVSAQWLAFGVFSLLAVAGGLGMTATMSMFRSGVFLMTSFIGVAGLFLLLSADLLGLLQVMMYVGGMLVMILFMVLFSGDPGGAMMAGHMKLPLVERLFSRGLAHGQQHEQQHGDGHAQHDEHQQRDMSMFTPVKRPALVLALVTGAVLIALLVALPPWPAVGEVPDPDSAHRIGELLMSKYMLAFEGAGLLILLGIFAAVFVQRPGARVDPGGRDALQAAVAGDPAPIEDDTRAGSAGSHAGHPGAHPGAHGPEERGP